MALCDTNNSGLSCIPEDSHWTVGLGVELPVSRGPQQFACPNFVPKRTGEAAGDPGS